MSSSENSSVGQPDYDLEHLRIVTSNAELKAMFHPLRSDLLDLLLQRAVTVAELADAVQRPPSTVAYHVNKLLDADLVRVVSTRRVRAQEERFYGRTAKLFYVGQISPDQAPLIANYLPIAAAESDEAHRADELRANLRHAHIPEDRVAPFWAKVMELFVEFSEIPRTGTRSYGFVAGLYPTQHPQLPPRGEEQTAGGD